MNIAMSESGVVSVAVAPVEKYSEHITCRGCGLTTDNLWRRILRKIRGKRQARYHTRSYCTGNKPPIDERQVPTMFGQQVNVETHYNCAGINRPHLHIACPSCSKSWLMECQG